MWLTNYKCSCEIKILRLISWNCFVRFKDTFFLVQNLNYIAIYGLYSLVTTAVCKFYILKKFTEMHFYEWSSFYAVFLCNSQILKLVPGTLWTAPSSRKNAEKTPFFELSVIAIYLPFFFLVGVLITNVWWSIKMLPAKQIHFLLGLYIFFCMQTPPSCLF